MENVIFWKCLFLPTKLAGSLISVWSASEIYSISKVPPEVYLAHTWYQLQIKELSDQKQNLNHPPKGDRPDICFQHVHGKLSNVALCDFTWQTYSFFLYRNEILGSSGKLAKWDACQHHSDETDLHHLTDCHCQFIWALVQSNLQASIVSKHGSNLLQEFICFIWRLSLALHRVWSYVKR